MKNPHGVRATQRKKQCCPRATKCRKPNSRLEEMEPRNKYTSRYGVHRMKKPNEAHGKQHESHAIKKTKTKTCEETHSRLEEMEPQNKENQSQQTTQQVHQP